MNGCVYGYEWKLYSSEEFAGVIDGVYSPLDWRLCRLYRSYRRSPLRQALLMEEQEVLQMVFPASQYPSLREHSLRSAQQRFSA